MIILRLDASHVWVMDAGLLITENADNTLTISNTVNLTVSGQDAQHLIAQLRYRQTQPPPQASPDWNPSPPNALQGGRSNGS